MLVDLEYENLDVLLDQFVFDGMKMVVEVLKLIVQEFELIQTFV